MRGEKDSFFPFIPHPSSLIPFCHVSHFYGAVCGRRGGIPGDNARRSVAARELPSQRRATAEQEKARENSES
jgi:hypothetical protein